MAGFGGSVKLKGESEYRQAIKAITTDVREMSKSLNEQATAFADSDKGLSNNEDAAKELESALEKQRQSIDKAKNAFSAYATELQKQTVVHQELKKEYNAAVKELNNIAKESGEASDAYKKQASVVEKLGDELTESNRALDKSKSAMNDAKKAIKDAERAFETATNAADNLGDEIEETSKEASDSAKDFSALNVAVGNLAADGVEAAAGALSDFIVDAGDGFSKLQAQTGATTEEMQEFKSEIMDMYNNAYGDSISDLGDRFAYVKQVTGEVDPSKIRELVENAITLEDTFGSDFNETIRGATALMDHFGLTGEEAFDLIAKGSQLGLDYTGELGDNLAEYAGNFAQAGYSADDYFQLLINGAQSGAYNLDKVNDSINEIKNRIGDGTIEKDLDKFSSGTQTVFEKWKTGEADMEDIIDSIVKDIQNCTNETDALTLAQIAFGTMGEDAALQVVTALTTAGTEFDNVQGKMNELKETRYDNVVSGFVSLGRTLQSELLLPLAEQLLPKLEEAGTFAINNIDTIIPLLEKLGVAVGVAFAINKISTFVTSLSTVVSLVANPVGGMIAVVGGLTAALVANEIQTQRNIEKEYGLSEAQQETIDKSKTLAEQYTATADEREKSFASITSEYGHLESLIDEYDTLLDSNGQVKAGYEGRAEFIKTTLAEAFGIEVAEIDNIVAANGRLGDSLDQIIIKKKADAILTAFEKDYTEAIIQKTEATATYYEAVGILEEKEKAYRDVQKEVAALEEKEAEFRAAGAHEAADQLIIDNRELYETESALKKAYEESKKAVDDSALAMTGYNQTIQNYEGLSSAIISGDVDAIELALLKSVNNFETAETGTKESLERQVEAMKTNYENLKKAVEDGAPNVTKEMVEEAETMVKLAVDELNKFEGDAAEAGKKGAEAMTSEVKKAQPKAKKEGENLAKATNDGAKSKTNEFTSTGKSQAKAYSGGVKEGQQGANTAGKNTSKAANDGMKSNNRNFRTTGQSQSGEYNSGMLSKLNELQRTGWTMGNSAVQGSRNLSNGFYSSGQSGSQGYGRGISSGNNYAWNSGLGIGQSARNGASSVSGYGVGQNFSIGFSNGISSWVNGVVNAASSIASRALSAIRSVTRTRSPSKETELLGGYFSQGFAGGIEKDADKVERSAGDIARAALKQISDISTLFTSAGVDSGDSYLTALEEQLSTDNLTEKLQGLGLADNLEGLRARVNESGALSNDSYTWVVNAFKDALGQMKVELDDRELGGFIDKTMSKLVYN